MTDVLHEAAPKARSSVSGLASPSLAVPAIAALVACVLLLRAQAVLGDPDTQWHISAGQWMLSHLAFPVTDLFSHTFAGSRWIAKEWLSQIALASSYFAGGWAGVVLLTALCVGFAYGVVAKVAAERFALRHAVLLALVCFTMGASGLIARPHVLSLPFIALMALGLARTLDARSGPPWFLLPLMTIWANAHGFFTVGFLMAGAVGLQKLIDAEPHARVRTALVWGSYGLALLAASCLTPYGVEPLLMTFSIAGGEPREFIVEWLPMKPGIDSGLALGFLVLALVACLKNPRSHVGRLIILAFLGYMMMRYGRFQLQFSIVAGILAVTPIAALFKLAGPTAPGPRMRLRAAAAILPPVFLALLLPAGPPPPSARPQAAVEAARAAGLTGPVYNSYDYGGYLTMLGIPTFVDGRTDQIFIGGWRRQLEAAITARSHEPLASLMASYNVRWALVQADGDEDRHLRAIGWREVHRDGHSVVFSAH